MNQPTEPTIAIDVYRTRRERVLAALRAAGGGVAIVPPRRKSCVTGTPTTPTGTIATSTI